MARASRIRRNLLFDIDVEELRDIVAQAGATQHQFRLAYSRALKRTASKMRMKALAELKTGLAPRKMDMLRRRLFPPALPGVMQWMKPVSGLVLMRSR